MNEQKHGAPSKLPTTEPKHLSSEPAQYPNPSALIELAASEAERKRIDEYAEVICKLRDEKKFSYRDIAEWLSKNGVPTDHNEVYRTHKAYCEGAVKRSYERKWQADNSRPGQKP